MNKVLPIKDAEKLRNMQEEMAADTGWHEERMFLLFELGIHTGLRISDLVRLKKKNVCGEWIDMTEKKTGKNTRIPLNATIRAIIQDRCRYLDLDDLLFPSRMRRSDGKQHPITTRCAYDDIKTIAKRFNLGDRIGCHTLRKTFGYWHYKQNHDLEILRQWFNHASQAITIRYIGIDEEEKRKSVQGFNPGGMVYRPREPISRGRPAMQSEPMEIKRADHETQGRIWGQKAQEALKKKK